jgi:hypothetical protein
MRPEDLITEAGVKALLKYSCSFVSIRGGTDSSPLTSSLSYAKRDAGDKIAAEAVLEAGENFFAAIADDFAQPHAAVHRDKQRSLADAGRLGMRDDGRIKQIIPNLHDLRFGAACVHAHSRKHAGQECSHSLNARGFRLFQRREINAAPLREDALPRA